MGEVIDYPQFLQAKVKSLVKSKRASGLDEMVCELAESCSEPWQSLSDVDDVWALKQLIEWVDSL